MRALVVYSSSGRMAPLAKGVARGLEDAGYAVQLMEVNQSQATPVPMSQYDLVCIGSPAVGMFGGQVATDVLNMLKRTTRLEGKPSAAFVRSKLFGTTRSLRKLMAAMEQQGSWVQDFAAISSPADGERLGKRLRSTIRED